MDAAFINNVYLFFGKLVIICLGVNLLIGFLNFKRFQLPFRRLYYFLIFNMVIEIMARSLAYSAVNNLPILHLYTLGEFILLSWFYKSLIHKPDIFQRWFIPGLLVGSLLILLNSLFFESIYAFNPMAKTFVQLVIISLAVLYFYNLSENQETTTPNEERSLRLINSAIIIYYSGSLFIFMCSQFFIDNSDLYKIFWAFNALLNLIFQLLIFWGIWKVISKKVPLSS